MVNWRSCGKGYEVSNTGMVQSVDRIITDSLGRCRLKPGRVLRLYDNGSGMRVWVTDNKGRRRQRMVHQLVLEAFVGPQPNGKLGCHEDGNHQNNHVNNLRWGSHGSNMQDKRRHGTTTGRCVIRSDGKRFKSLTEASESINKSTTPIWRTCNGKQLSAGGYGWRYE